MARNSAALFRLFAALLLAAPVWTIGVSAAHAAPLATACSKPHAPQMLNTDEHKKQLYYYACSGAYDHDLNKVLAAARAYVAVRAAQVSKPAIVLDIDETSLSNLPIELADDFAYIKKGTCSNPPTSPCGFDDWFAHPYAKAIDGTLALFNTAKAHHVAVFFITGRRLSTNNAQDDPLFKATRENLKKAGYASWDGLILRPMQGAEGGDLSVTEYKSGARARITREGYTIIANVGDQQSDLTGGYTERTFKLPNPFYFIP